MKFNVLLLLFTALTSALALPLVDKIYSFGTKLAATTRAIIAEEVEKIARNSNSKTTRTIGETARNVKIKMVKIKSSGASYKTPSLKQEIFNIYHWNKYDRVNWKLNPKYRWKEYDVVNWKLRVNDEILKKVKTIDPITPRFSRVQKVGIGAVGLGVGIGGIIGEKDSH
jgi:hypothetical protein